jgi:hypothetical protein
LKRGNEFLADRESYLTALIPPGNVLEALEKNRFSLRGSAGLVAIRSLPPLAVLSVHEANPGPRALDAWAERCAGRYGTTAWILHGHSLYLGIDPSPLDAPPPATETRSALGLQAFPGLWMAPSQNAAELPEPPPRLSWGISTIALLRVVAEDDPWWSAVYWEFVAERRTRRQRGS